jgi:hypothetical protein
MGMIGLALLCSLAGCTGDFDDDGYSDDDDSSPVCSSDAAGQAGSWHWLTGGTKNEIGDPWHIQLTTPVDKELMVQLYLDAKDYPWNIQVQVPKLDANGYPLSPNIEVFAEGLQGAPEPFTVKASPIGSPFGNIGWAYYVPLTDNEMPVTRLILKDHDKPDHPVIADILLPPDGWADALKQAKAGYADQHQKRITAGCAVTTP